MNRRSFLIQVISGMISVGLWRHQAVAESPSVSNSTQKYPFEWRVSIAHFNSVKRSLKFEGEVKKEKNTKGLPVVYVIVGVVLLVYLAKSILALRRDIVHGGIVIDTRHGKLVVETNKALSGGVIMVVSDNGTTLYERDEIADPNELVAALTKGLKGK